MGEAARRWAELQSGRGIPPEILARVSWDPWQHDPSFFAPPAVPRDTPSRAAGLALLAEPGTVLDVGCGGGDAAFALAARASGLIGVDRQQDMLDLFTAGAAARGIDAATVRGRWPDAASEVHGPHDVVVSHHVLHNVVDLPPFLSALTAAASRGVVVEMLPQHPMAWLDPLWERFHDLHRPPSATDEDAVAVLAELGITPEVRRFVRERRHPHDPGWVTRRLCLPRDRTAEVEAAMAEVPLRDPTAVTVTWTV